MIIIGIDPGTSCGWSILKDEDRIASGTWDLKPRRHEGGGMRYFRARQYFLQLVTMVQEEQEGDIVVGYEEIRRHRGVDAAHIYGGIVGMITAVCEELEIPFKAVTVSDAKTIATGKGNASKTAMVKAANKNWNLDLKSSQDDEADALWIARALYEQLKV